MKSIWKFPLPSYPCVIEMPSSAEVLTVQVQDGIPCLWALVEVENDLVRREFRVYGTGGQLPINPGKYIGTFQLLGGGYVGHVFEAS